jgi:hypothetical protein
MKLGVAGKAVGLRRRLSGAAGLQAPEKSSHGTPMPAPK